MPSWGPSTQARGSRCLIQGVCWCGSADVSQAMLLISKLTKIFNRPNPHCRKHTLISLFSGVVMTFSFPCHSTTSEYFSTGAYLLLSEWFLLHFAADSGYHEQRNERASSVFVLGPVLRTHFKDIWPILEIIGGFGEFSQNRQQWSQIGINIPEPGGESGAACVTQGVCRGAGRKGSDGASGRRTRGSCWTALNLNLVAVIPSRVKSPKQVIFLVAAQIKK